MLEIKNISKKFGKHIIFQDVSLTLKEGELIHFYGPNGSGKSTLFKIITDIGSGLNYKRKGFNELIHLICNKQCSQVVVNYQDRLARFGFELIQAICQENNIGLIVLNQTQAEDPNQELVQDVLSVITVFSAKLYGKRSHKNAKIIKENTELFTENN